MNNDLTKLPPPPKGQTSLSPELFSHLPPPPKGQVGIHPDQIASIQQPQVGQKSLLSNTPPSDNFGTNLGLALKSVATGIGKSAVRGVQDLGKGFLGAFGQNPAGFIPQRTNPLVDTSKVGIPDSTLQNKNVGETVGGALETGGELAAGLSGGNAEELATKAKTAYDTFKEGRAAKLVGQEFQDTLNTVKPRLTPTQEAEAKAAGRGQTKGGLLNKTTIAPSTRETEMAQFAHEAGVSSKNPFDKNIQLMKDAQKVSAQTLRSGLQGAEGTWNRNDVVGSLNKIKTPLTIKSDATLTKLANNFKQAIVDLSSGMTKKPEGLLDLRQGVDNLIDKEFPANIYSKDTPVGQYVRQVREVLNTMTESKLPEGKLPNGSTFRNELRRQTLLYDAIDNVAANAPKAGESARPILQKVKTFAKDHPYITGAGTAAGYGTARKLGVPLP